MARGLFFERLIPKSRRQYKISYSRPLIMNLKLFKDSSFSSILKKKDNYKFDRTGDLFNFVRLQSQPKTTLSLFNFYTMSAVLKPFPKISPNFFKNEKLLDIYNAKKKKKEERQLKGDARLLKLLEISLKKLIAQNTRVLPAMSFLKKTNLFNPSHLIQFLNLKKNFWISEMTIVKRPLNQKVENLIVVQEKLAQNIADKVRTIKGINFHLNRYLSSYNNISRVSKVSKLATRVTLPEQASKISKLLKFSRKPLLTSSNKYLLMVLNFFKKD